MNESPCPTSNKPLLVAKLNHIIKELCTLTISKNNPTASNSTLIAHDPHNPMTQKFNIIFLDVDGVIFSGQDFKAYETAIRKVNLESLKADHEAQSILEDQYHSSIYEIAQILSFNSQSIKMIQELCEQTAAKIVLSSNWRRNPHQTDKPRPLNILKRLFDICGLGPLIIDHTPTQYEHRARNIESWLIENHYRVNKWVAIDDDHSDFSLRMPNPFVPCDYQTGFTSLQMNLVRDKLSSLRKVNQTETFKSWLHFKKPTHHNYMHFDLRKTGLICRALGIARLSLLEEIAGLFANPLFSCRMLKFEYLAQEPCDLINMVIKIIISSNIKMLGLSHNRIHDITPILRAICMPSSAVEQLCIEDNPLHKDSVLAIANFLWQRKQPFVLRMNRQHDLPGTAYESIISAARQNPMVRVYIDDQYLDKAQVQDVAPAKSSTTTTKSSW